LEDISFMEAKQTNLLAQIDHPFCYKLQNKINKFIVQMNVNRYDWEKVNGKYTRVSYNLDDRINTIQILIQYADASDARLVFMYSEYNISNI